MTTSLLVKKLKEANQDHEWYPTTNEIIETIYKDISDKGRTNSIMDVGAGNGNFFKVLEEFESHKEYPMRYHKYAIEKSMILIDQMPDDIFIIGTEFHEQTFIDKKMDIIFCNPPYSEWEEWTSKLIREANSPVLYIVIPNRWQNNRQISGEIKTREASVKILGTYSFLDSEYRKARVTVDLLKISLKEASYGNDKLEVDPFNIWFDENFKIAADKVDDSWKFKQKKADHLKELVAGKNVIEKLAEFYHKEFDKLLNNYKALESLDGSILKEIGVDLSGLKESLKSKIAGLKTLYWQELFDNFNKITERLTSDSRKSLLSTLTRNTSIDFTAKNAYAVVIWTIKNANKYYNEQLLKVYKLISNSENVQLYKSNHRIIEDGWRYSREKITHYILDYRIVHHHYNAINNSDYTWEDVNGLHKSAHTIINDIFTIARNLGFAVSGRSENEQWKAGKKVHFSYLDSDFKVHEFAEIKAFKNGNLHFKFNQKFMKKWNVEAARLNNWIKSPVEATEEMQNITLEEATKYFKSNKQLISSDIKLIA